MLNSRRFLSRLPAAACLALGLAGLNLAALPAQAQSGGHDHAAHAAAAAASAASSASSQEALSEGEIRKIDLAARKITLKHGEISNLGMPPMTMVFQVPDAALLQSFKTGDKVRFRAEKVGGAYLVTRLEAQP